MKLFIISQGINNGYDTYDSAVVAAESEEEAKKIDPSGHRRWDSEKRKWMFCYSDGTEEVEDKHYSWVDDIDEVKVAYIGETDMEAGLILASFNAG